MREAFDEGVLGVQVVVPLLHSALNLQFLLIEGDHFLPEPIDFSAAGLGEPLFECLERGKQPGDFLLLAEADVLEVLAVPAGAHINFASLI
jgi:hypothetical protein